MKTIQKDELYEHLNGFLKTKGIELTDGSYAQTIQKGCSILADAINIGQKGVQKAKSGIDERLDKMRQVIHEKTAPRSAPKAPAAKTPPTPSASAPSNSSTGKPAQKNRKRSRRKS